MQIDVKPQDVIELNRLIGPHSHNDQVRDIIIQVIEATP
jgi:hypothetical protein